MTIDLASDLVADAVWLLLLICLVVIVPSLLIGLCVSIFQAVTQINEQTLSFLPRLITTFCVLNISGHWIFVRLSDFTIAIFNHAAELVR